MPQNLDQRDGEGEARKHPTPSEYMRKLRPELYSDTETRVIYTVDAPTLEYFLESLTSRNETHEFEVFCRKLCERVICPHLRPNSGPDGGGDGKTDTETIVVADEVAKLSYFGEPNGGERWGFAFSAKEKWQDKVRSDVKGIAGTGRQYDRVYCVTSRFAKAKTRADLEQKLTAEYGFAVTILDRSWIVDQIVNNDRADLAFHYLGIGQENNDPLRLGPTDYSRSRELDEIEKNFADPDAYAGIERQRVTEALVAAKLSRNLERPRLETDGRFARAVRLAEQDGDYRQELSAKYEAIWTAYWYFDDLPYLLSKYDEFEELAFQSSHMRNMELLTNILQLLFNSVLLDHASREDCRLDERAEKVRAALQAMADERDRPNNSLEARSSLLLLRLNYVMIDGDTTDLQEIWKHYGEILDQAEGLGEFPAKRLARLIEMAGNVAGNDGEYNALVEKLADFIGKRESEGQSGVILLNRANKLDLDSHFDIIRLAGRATTRLTKKEYTAELARALQLLTIAYRKADLLWAARASCIFVAAALIIEGEEDGQIPVSFVPTMKMLAWISLELGHLPDTIYSLQMLNASLATLPLSDQSKEKLSKDIQELDIALGSVFLNASDADLARLETLPDLLESLGLMTARMSLLYVLGHEDTLLSDGSVPESESIESLRDMMGIVASQPVARQAAPKFIFNDPPEMIATSVMGMAVRIDVSIADEVSMQVGELVAASLEAFFATALQQDIIPHTEEFTIRVSVSDQLDEPTFEISKLSSIGELVWPASLELHAYSNQAILREILMEVAVKTLSWNFILDDLSGFAEALFADDGVQERMAMVLAVGNSYHRFTDKHLARLDDWSEHMRTKYECRIRPKIKIIQFEDKPEDSVTREPREVKYERPTVDSHKQVKVHSVIDVHAWDQAKWRGAGYMRFDPEYPPVMALLFENEEAARAIFARWHERVGPADRDNEIRVAIIRSHDASHPSHYIIQIASAPPNLDAMVPGQSFVMASRCLENTPDNDVNLSRFLRDYQTMGAYYLAAGVLQGGVENEPKWLEGMILKGHLSVKRAADIQPMDVEMTALRSVLGDNAAPDGAAA